VALAVYCLVALSANFNTLWCVNSQAYQARSGLVAKSTSHITPVQTGYSCPCHAQTKRGVSRTGRETPLHKKSTKRRLPPPSVRGCCCVQTLLGSDYFIGSNCAGYCYGSLGLGASAALSFGFGVSFGFGFCYRLGFGFDCG